MPSFKQIFNETAQQGEIPLRTANDAKRAIISITEYIKDKFIGYAVGGQPIKVMGNEIPEEEMPKDIDTNEIQGQIKVNGKKQNQPNTVELFATWNPDKKYWSLALDINSLKSMKASGRRKSVKRMTEVDTFLEENFDDDLALLPPPNDKYKKKTPEEQSSSETEQPVTGMM